MTENPYQSPLSEGERLATGLPSWPVRAISLLLIALGTVVLLGLPLLVIEANEVNPVGLIGLLIEGLMLVTTGVWMRLPSRSRPR